MAIGRGPEGKKSAQGAVIIDCTPATPPGMRVRTGRFEKLRPGGTYHAFDFAKYAHRYLAEAQYRFNRRFNLRSILARLLRAASLTNPTPAASIRVAEVGR